MIQKGLFLRAHHVILPPFIVCMSGFDHTCIMFLRSPDNLRTGFERLICDDADAPPMIILAAISDGVVMLQQTRMRVQALSFSLINPA